MVARIGTGPWVLPVGQKRRISPLQIALQSAQVLGRRLPLGTSRFYNRSVLDDDPPGRPRLGSSRGNLWKSVARCLVAVGFLVSAALPPKAFGKLLASATPVLPIEDTKESPGSENESTETSVKSEASNPSTLRQGRFRQHHTTFLPLPLGIPSGQRFTIHPSRLDRPADSLCNGLSTHYRC